MLAVIGAILIFFWLCGVIIHYTFGGFIHIILIIAIIMILVECSGGPKDSGDGF